MKNLYHICTGFLAKTVVMIVLLIAGGVNVVWGEDFNYTSNVDVKLGSNSSSVGVLISRTIYEGYKLGTSSSKGSISFIIPEGTNRLSFFVAGWKGDGNHTLDVESSSGTLSNKSVVLINDPNISGTASNFEISKDYLSSYFHEILLSDVLTETTVTLRTNSIRAVVWGINYFTDVDDDALCVKFNAGENGTYNGGDVAETVAGDGIVLPNVVANDGWTFIGWATTENSAIADAGKVGMVFHPSTDNQVLYAVYEAASATHTAKFFVNGEQIGETQELYAGDGVVFPNEIPPADINGKKFVGWMKGEISRSQDDVPVLLENAKMENSDVEFHAVFAKENSDDGQKIILSDEFGPRSSNDSGAFNSENFTGTKYKAFASQFGGVKLGTENYYGYITTKPLNLSQPFIVSVKVKGWTTVEGTLDVIIDDDKQTKKSYTYSAVSSSQYETAIFEFDAATSSSTIRIATSSKRAYIDDVVVTTAGAVYSGYCTSLLTVKKAVSVVTSENRKIYLSEEDVTGDFVEAVSKDESVKGKNVIVFVGKDIALKDDIENVAVMQSNGSYLCRNLVLTDDGAFSTSIPFVANTATYTRALGADANDYGTICLPYGVTSDSNIQYYKLLSCGTDVLTFAKVNQVDAYTPALYHRLNNGNIEVSASDVLIAATGAMVQQGESGKMVGVMKPTSVVDGTSCTVPKDGYAMVVDSNCYYIKGGQFWSLDERVNLKAFRAYMSCNQASGASKAAVLNLCFDEGTPTDVRIIERNDGLVDMVFDLGGRRGGQNARGVRIVNGRKIVQR